MRAPYIVTIRGTPVDWPNYLLPATQRLSSRRNNLRSRQGFQQEQNSYRPRYPTPEIERPIPPRPPSRKSVYGRPQTRRQVKILMRPAPLIEETDNDSEFSSTEPEWSRGPFPGDLGYNIPEERPAPIPLRRSIGYRTLTRSLGPAPVPCKHPISFISKSVPNMAPVSRVSLLVRPGTYVVWRSPRSRNSKLTKSKSDETANSSKPSQMVAGRSDTDMVAHPLLPKQTPKMNVTRPSTPKMNVTRATTPKLKVTRATTPRVKVTRAPTPKVKVNRALADPGPKAKVNRAMADPAPKAGPSKPPPPGPINNGPLAYNRKGKAILAPNALIRLLNAKQIRHANTFYKERIRNAKASEPIASAFRREPKP